MSILVTTHQVKVGALETVKIVMWLAGLPCRKSHFHHVAACFFSAPDPRFVGFIGQGSLIMGKYRTRW
jgi:hypothetical protein